MSGGMPVYRKQGDPDRWLMFHPSSKKRTLVRTGNKGTDVCRAFLICDPPCLPENGIKHTWQVLIGESGDDYHTQTDVDISIATPQEVADAAALIAAATEALAASVRADGHKVETCTVVGFNDICFAKLNFLFLFHKSQFV